MLINVKVRRNTEAQLPWDRKRDKATLERVVQYQGKTKQGSRVKRGGGEVRWGGARWQSATGTLQYADNARLFSRTARTCNWNWNSLLSVRQQFSPQRRPSLGARTEQDSTGQQELLGHYDIVLRVPSDAVRGTCLQLASQAMTQRNCSTRLLHGWGKSKVVRERKRRNSRVS